MILSSRSQFEEDSNDPPEPSAIRRELERTPRVENVQGSQTPIERSTGSRKKTLGVLKLHYFETAESPVILG